MKNKLLYFFLLTIIVLTMYNNLEHSATVYYQIQASKNSHNPGYNWVQSYIVVIVLDLSVIAFILTGNRRESVVFAWLLFVINAIYFDTIGNVYAITRANNTGGVIQLVNQLISKILFSAMFAYTVHRFSYLFHKKNQEPDLQTQLSDQENMIVTLSETNNRHLEAEEKFLQSIEELQSQVRRLEKEKKELFARVEIAENKLSRKRKTETA